MLHRSKLKPPDYRIITEDATVARQMFYGVMRVPQSIATTTPTIETGLFTVPSSTVNFASVAADGRIFVSAYGSNNFFVINESNNTISSVPVANVDNWSKSALHQNGKIYAANYSNVNFLEISSLAGNADVLRSSANPNSDSFPTNIRTSLAGFIYAASFSPRIHRLNVLQGSPVIETTSISTGDQSDSYGFYLGCDRYVYMLVYSNTNSRSKVYKFLESTPSSLTLVFDSINSTSKSFSDKSSIGADGCLYLLPSVPGEKAVKLNITTTPAVIEEFQMPTNVRPGYGISLGADGYIYFFSDAGFQSPSYLYRVNTNTGSTPQVQQIALGGGAEYGAVLGTSGNIWFIPYYSTSFTRVNIAGSANPLNFAASPFVQSSF